MKHWGAPTRVKESFMEDGTTRLGVMVFSPDSTPQGSKLAIRPYRVYATNGMAQRRMPCEQEPHGDPSKRIELIAYARQDNEWVTDLLIELARYPFRYRSGFEVGHTLPVTPKPGNLWSGYLLSYPRCEPEEFDPLPLYSEIEDWTFFAQVIGLKADELELAIKIGGPAFMEDRIADDCHLDISPLDVDRKSILGGDECVTRRCDSPSR
jgi:hypothetical protein